MKNHGCLLILLFTIGFCLEMASFGNAQRVWKRVLTVDQSGKTGQFVKIQDAIDAVPSNNVHPIFIRVEPGIYKEKIIVPQDKPFITLSGRNAYTTVITWNDGGDIFKSPTVSVFSSDFVGRYLTIQVNYSITQYLMRVKLPTTSFSVWNYLQQSDQNVSFLAKMLPVI